MTLVEKKCVPCEGNGALARLEGDALLTLINELDGNWRIINDHHLEKEYRFKDFKGALEFANKVGALAETEGHHPDIHVAWGKVRLMIWTHALNGLSENDFILAAKCDLIKIA